MGQEKLKLHEEPRIIRKTSQWVKDDQENSLVSQEIQKLQEIPRMFEKSLKRVFHQDYKKITITIRTQSDFAHISFESWI